MDMVEIDDVAFPPGKFDEHSEPMDARESTSWTQTIDEISPVELMEVQTVNSTVPFMLISNFTPLLKVIFCKFLYFLRNYISSISQLLFFPCSSLAHFCKFSEYAKEVFPPYFLLFAEILFRFFWYYFIFHFNLILYLMCC
jgi:hypothetical protein